jgi:hypothetical protein
MTVQFAIDTLKKDDNSLWDNILDLVSGLAVMWLFVLELFLTTSWEIKFFIDNNVSYWQIVLTIKTYQTHKGTRFKIIFLHVRNKRTTFLIKTKQTIFLGKLPQQIQTPNQVYDHLSINVDVRLTH